MKFHGLTERMEFLISQLQKCCTFSSLGDTPMNYTINWQFMEALLILINVSKKLFQNKYI